MFTELNLKTKLILTFLLIGILSISITGGLCYLNSRNTLEDVYSDKLTSIRESKKQQIEAYFSQIRNQVKTLSCSHMIIDAMNQFKTAFCDIKKDNEITDSKISQYRSDLRDYYDEYLVKLNVKDKIGIEQYFPENDETIILQYHYLSKNRNPRGSKGNLEMAADGSQYGKIHSKYHPVIRDYQKNFGYYDVLLIDAQTGHIVYSVFKETDFATNLLTGPYKDTNLARVFKEAQNAHDNEFSRLIDFEPYGPSYNNPASFIASPIYDGDRKIGILVFQVPISEIDSVMTGDYNWKNEGLGESGETYIVGPDKRMRNDSRFLIEDPDRYFELLEEAGTDNEVIDLIKLHSTTIMLQEIHTAAVEDALRGNTNTSVIDDYRDISVLSSYTPLNIEDVNWVILSEIDREEAFSSLRVIVNRIFLITVAISVLITIIAFSVSEDIAQPILMLVKNTKDIARGDFSKRVVITRRDEIGHLASSFNDMALNLEESRKQLQESEEHKKQLLNSLKDGIYQCEPQVEGAFTWVNQACAEMFGYKSTQEMIGLKVKDIYVDPGDRRRLVEKLEKDGFLKDIPTSFIKRNGECFPAERSSNIIKDVKGEPILIEGIIRDVTERKKIEDRLRKLSLAVEQSPATVIITDTDGKIEYVNSKFTQLTGYSVDESIGKKPSFLKSGRQSTEIYRELWETITSGGEWRGEFCNKKKNGEFYWEFASISPIKDDKGVVTSYIAVKEDITERKCIEEELRLSHKMSSIGRLSASVFHEILNPVNIISAHIQLLLMETAKGSKTEEDLKSIQSEIDRIVNITDNLLKFSAKKDSETERTEINDILESTLSLIKPELNLKSIKSITKFEKNLPEVMVHGSEIREAFLKFITNSIEAMPEGGTLTVKTRSRCQSANLAGITEGDCVEISFSDTGCGITKENIDRIYEPFFSTKKENKGVGLGLSAAYAIIEGYEGKISVETEEGKGTTFIIDLPVKI